MLGATGEATVLGSGDRHEVDLKQQKLFHDLLFLFVLRSHSGRNIQQQYGV